MQHRDYIAINKIMSEMQVGIDLLGDTSIDKSKLMGQLKEILEEDSE